jgi:hypothetical protein
MDIQTELKQLYERHESLLPTYAWASEADRWAELVFCLLSQCSDQDAETIRGAVAMLEALGLLDVDLLATLAERKPEGTVIAYVLKQHGLEEQEVQCAVATLIRAALAFQRDYEGKVQRYLRRHAERMRDDLVRAFGDAPLNKAQLRQAVSHWLQNVASLPVSLENPSVQAFCKDHGISIEELIRAADDLDLNIALIDDLLALDQEAGE